MNKRAILASGLGNIIEWYDFGLFAAFSTIYATLFFPSQDPRLSLIEIFGIFAVGFVCRPIGALIFGHFGDRIGRAKTLRASILIITVPTLLMAFLPTYQQVGMFAPLLLILLRLIQGLSVGGEYAGNIVYLVENAPIKHRALFASFAPTAANFGLLLATVVVLILKVVMIPSAFMQYGWRIPFIIGAGIGWYVLLLRQSLTETLIFKSMVQYKQTVSLPFITAITTQPLAMLRVMGLVCLNAVFYYLCFVYTQSYLVIAGHLTKVLSLSIELLAVSSMLILVPLLALVGDLLGRKMSYAIVTIGVMVFAIPNYHWLASHHLGLILMAIFIFTLLSSLEQSTSSVTVVEQFSTNIRYTGVSFSYNLTQAIFGGTAPLVAVGLIDYFHMSTAPAYYLIFVGVITFFTAAFSLQETSNKAL